MSWDSYRDSLTQSGLVDKAAICGMADGAIWSQSPDFNVCSFFKINLYVLYIIKLKIMRILCRKLIYISFFVYQTCSKINIKLN